VKGIYVEELEHKTVRKELVDLVTKGSSVEDITHKFPENYLTCITFYQVLLKMAQSGMEWKILNLLLKLCG